MAAAPKLLYSTNTRLAYKINQEYYEGLHYVFCNPFFNAESVPHLEHDTPPSSTPCDLFRNYRADVDGKDSHSSSIKRNKTGLRLGIRAKQGAGIITEEQAQDLYYVVKNADLQSFLPLLYVIPYHRVSRRARRIPPTKAAALFGHEYLIEELPRSDFDVLWL